VGRILEEFLMGVGRDFKGVIDGVLDKFMVVSTMLQT
tara:strand:+ start:49 stop:159 length:111 start_codon:yes stop_codon:yes gene_type:complete